MRSFTSRHFLKTGVKDLMYTDMCYSGVTPPALLFHGMGGVMVKNKFMAYLRMIGLELAPDWVTPCLIISLLLLGAAFSFSSFLSSGSGNFDYSSGGLQ